MVIFRRSTRNMRRPPSSDLQIIVLSNREPYKHERGSDGTLQASRCSSGVVNAVEPLLLQHTGVWVATGSGDADREAANNADGVAVPAENPRYRLRRVWLEDDEWRGHYEGFANSGLWPLCHRTSIAPAFYATDFGMYELVNRRFAEAVSEEARVAAPVVLVQDYQCALAPAMIRRELPLGRIATFWHIPWPTRDVFRQCPWSHALLEGLLGSTLIGFQTQVDRENFLRCAEPLAPVDVDQNVVRWKGRRVRLGVYPASVDVHATLGSRASSVAACRASVRRQLGLPDDMVLGVGIDRLDYTKGLEEKFIAVERLLECRPELIGRFSFVQVAEPSRECLPAYQQTRDRVAAAAERINSRYGGRRPIVLIPEHQDQAAVTRLLRAADLCYVGSLHDGMNLVSKEFVAVRDDEQGVLVLSAFAGASFELRDALIVNPYDIEQVARSLSAAIDMPPVQQRHRMHRMRRVVAAWDARSWAREILSDTWNDAAEPCDVPVKRRYSQRKVQPAQPALPSASAARNV